MHRVNALTLSLLLVLGLTACRQDPAKASQAFVDSGNQYFSQQKYPEAILQYRNALQLLPRLGEARYKLAQAYERTGDRQNALREYVRAADLLPDNIDAQLKSGTYLLVFGQYEDARTRAQKALALDPKNIDAQIMLGNSMAGLKNLEGAIGEIQKAIQQNPDSSQVYANLGSLQLVKGDTDAAEAAFKKAVDLDPKSVNAHLAMANLYWSTNRLGEAEKSLLAAVALDPKNGLANRTLATFYMASNRAREAEPFLKSAAEGEGDLTSRFTLADYYLATQRGDEAIPLLEAIAKTDDGYALATTRLAALQFEGGKRGIANVTIDEVLRKAPKNPQALIVKARFLLADKNLDEALAKAMAAIAADATLPAAHATLGMVHRARNEFEPAIAAYSEVMKLEPQNLTAQLELARLNLAAGRASVAAQYAEQVTKLQPEGFNGHLLLGQALLASGDTARAEPEIRRVVAAQPTSAEAHLQVGLLEVMKGDPKAARRSFERAAALAPGMVDPFSALVGLDLAERDLAQVRARVEKRLASQPSDPTVLFVSAQAYQRLGDAAKAEDLLRKTIALDPANLRAYGMLGGMYLSQRKLDEALTEFTKASDKQPKQVGPHTMVAFILQLQNKNDDAKKRYEQVLALDPRAAVAANNLAWIYAEEGASLDLALQLAQTAKSVLPDQPEVNDTLGWVYLKKGLPSLAIPPLEQSVEKDPTNPVLQYHLGLAYMKNGERRKGRTALEEALRLKSDFDGADDARKALASAQS